MKRRAAARARTLVATTVAAVAGLAVGLLIAVVGPRAVGWQSHTVISGSMSPTIATGDLVVSRPVRAHRLHAGEIVTFRDPLDSNRFLTHRIQHVDTGAGSTEATTRGDANTGTETWTVPADGTVGVVVYRLPRVGYLVHGAGSPLGRVVLIAVPALIWGLLTLVEVWRSPRPPRPVRQDVLVSHGGS